MSSAGCEGGEIGSEGAVELAGDEAFEAADGFFLGLAFCDAALHVAAGSVAVAEPDEDDEPPWDSWRVWCAPGKPGRFTQTRPLGRPFDAARTGVPQRQEVIPRRLPGNPARVKTKASLRLG